MKKLALLACAGVFLALPNIAAADGFPLGGLSGSATLVTTGPFDFGVTLADGGTTYVGKENDRSKDPDGTASCADDVGTVVINTINYPVVCAHFVLSSRGSITGSPKMRFAWGSGPYNVAKLTDNGIPNPAGQSPDTVAFGTTNSLAAAKLWVNTGAIGSGNVGGWTFATVLPDTNFGSDFSVHA